jgi:hypothetical protein
MLANKTIDYIIQRSYKYSPIIIFTGNTQAGKSTSSWYLANKIMQYKKNVDKPTFDEWNYKEFCCQNLDEFIDKVDKYDNELIAIEEAGFQLDSKEWYSKENRIFNKILQTQAYKHNIYFIVLPYACGIAKDHRRMIDMLLWVKKKIEDKKISLIYPVLIRKQYWKLDETDYKPFFFPKMLIKYNGVILEKSKEYTDWLIDYKKTILEKLKHDMRDMKKYDEKKIYLTFASDGKVLEGNV